MGNFETTCETCGGNEDGNIAAVSLNPNSNKARRLARNLANRKKCTDLMEIIGKGKGVGEEPYIQTMIESHCELYEKVFLHKLKEMRNSLPDMDTYSTADEFNAFLESDIQCMISLVFAKYTAFEAVVYKVQGRLSTSSPYPSSYRYP
jgi:hypothetical protein